MPLSLIRERNQCSKQTLRANIKMAFSFSFTAPFPCPEEEEAENCNSCSRVTMFGLVTKEQLSIHLHARNVTFVAEVTCQIFYGSASPVNMFF